MQRLPGSRVVTLNCPCISSNSLKSLWKRNNIACLFFSISNLRPPPKQIRLNQGSESFGLPDGSVVKNLPASAETLVPSVGRKDPLEEGTAADFSILAWKIPWTQEPGSYSPWWSQKVSHNLVIKQQKKVLAPVKTLYVSGRQRVMSVFRRT